MYPARRGVCLLCALILPGCASVGPDYRAPSPIEASAWAHGDEAALAAEPPDAAALAAWWRTFDDPVLSALVEKALAGNPDLAAARARLARSRATLGATRTGRRPQLDATASATASEASAQTSGAAEQIEIYRAGFDASWELDLFGGVRRAVEAAVADVEAADADASAVRVSLVAEVAATYADLRTFAARLALAESNLAAQAETYELVSSRFEAGLVSRLDVEQARSNLESTRSQIPDLRVGLAAARHRLAVLTGGVPGSLALDDGGGKRLLPPPSVAVGIPAEALRRRPDVRAAERRVAAETARVGVAVAELYPSFSLGGSIGLEALDLDQLTSDSSFFGFGPSFSWRIFDRRAIRAGIDAQTAVQEEALSLYQATVLAALEEVENALVAFAEEQERRASLERAAAAAEEAEALARDLYRSGLRTFQEVLDAQRTLLTLQDQLAESEGAVITRLITIYKALGGGWTPIAETGATTASPGGANS